MPCPSVDRQRIVSARLVAELVGVTLMELRSNADIAYGVRRRSATAQLITCLLSRNGHGEQRLIWRYDKIVDGNLLKMRY